MNDFISCFKEAVYLYNAESETIRLNDIAQSYALINAELKNLFKKMKEDKKRIELSNLDDTEIIINHLGTWKGQDIFIIYKTLEIERTLLNTEKVKALKDEVDIFLNAIHDDILITDGKGIITRAYESFEKVYNVKKEEVEGRSVFELERMGIFKPSITAKVLKCGEQVTMMQETGDGRKLIVTAAPVKNQQGDILKVISFTRDLTDFVKLKEQYALLENKVERFTAEIEELRGKNKSYPDVVGNSKKIQNVIDTIYRVSEFDASILIEGESGVGKTMFARIIHSKSGRAEGPLIEIDCGAIPENLLESELFGYEKGAFTGANVKGKVGLIELADCGTLFLDEIGELPLNLQMKLLKVIQDKKITRIGGTENISVDFRLITATNRNLKNLISKGLFREDLYYRLNVIYIELPPIRERKDDIIHLSMYFLDKYNKKYYQNKTFKSEIFDYFMKYEWPGNIRELENLIERMVLVSKQDIIDVSLIPQIMKKNNSKRKYDTLEEALEEVERQMVIEAYEKRKTTVGVAKELGISQPTAVRKIKKHILLSDR